MLESQPGRHGGILIVDDHPLTVYMLVELLADAFPARTLSTAATGEEALAVCRRALPCLVIMDIGLRGINGIEAARRIKVLSPGVRIVMHSGADHLIYRERSAAAGADAFVSKDNSYAELIPVIARLLDGSAASRH